MGWNRDGYGHSVQTTLRRDSTRKPALTEAAYRCLFLACDCTAVIATASTISSTLHPRERSLQGLSSPCSIGPIAVPPVRRSVSLYAMLPALRSGKISTFALPPTGEPGAFD